LLLEANLKAEYKTLSGLLLAAGRLPFILNIQALLFLPVFPQSLQTDGLKYATTSSFEIPTISRHIQCIIPYFTFSKLRNWYKVVK
jgi:hypothetical protein